MNRLRGVVRSVLRTGPLARVEVETAAGILRALVLGGPWRPGLGVRLAFKETEPRLLRAGDLRPNRVEGHVLSLERGTLLSRLEVAIAGSSLGVAALHEDWESFDLSTGTKVGIEIPAQCIALEAE